MKTKAISNVLGMLGVFSCLIFWLLLAFKANLDRISFGSRLPWFSWFVLWGVGLVLLLIAGALGSKRWFIAALLPVVSSLVAIVLAASL